MLSGEHDAESASVAERALGLAARELHDVAAVRSHLSRAIEHAESAGLLQRAAEARLSLAAEYVTLGRPAAALRELARASRDLVEDHPQVHAQFAFIYTRLGRYADAIESNTRGLASAERLGDTSRMALILANRGIARGFAGELPEAERDLRRARDLCSELGEQFGMLDATHNLAWVLSRAGRLPESLALYDEADTGLGELGASLAVCRLDRAEALLAAGLSLEAKALAEDAAAELAATGHLAELSEAQLLQSRAALLGGAAVSAVAAAAEAAAGFETQDRPRWALVARAVECQARAAIGEDVSVTASLLATKLAEAGLREEEHEVRLAAGVPELLTPLAALRRNRSARTRARAWQAEMALRAATGDARGTLSAAAAALRAWDDLRAGLGATELHASAAVHGWAITAGALRLAVRRGPDAVLQWSERARATTLQHAPVRPPGDDELAADLAQLRRVTAARQEALLDGEPASALYSAQLDLEDSVRRRARHAATRRSALTIPSLSQVRSRVGAGRLVSLFDIDEQLYALVVERRRTRVVEVCRSKQVAIELQHLRLALRRAVMRSPGAGDALAAAAVRVDALLRPAFDGTTRTGGRLAIVPTPGLAAVPWTLLPGLSAYEIEVSPSVAIWSRPARRPAVGRRIAVAGPGLAQADAEVRDVASADPGIEVLTGPDAGVDAVLARLDGAALAHLACHGSFRVDNPMFSSLRLADGPLTVYDIERLSTAPAELILSACDSARLGQDLLGLAAAFFSLGTETLIASVVPVEDGATRRLMAALHRHRRNGLQAAAALRAAQADEAGPSAAGFVCLRAGQTVSG